MPCALYGKLPAKRDFIALNTPREFLECWEPWMHGAITASRLSLGEAWLPAYLGAPLWRFSLGADICGVPVTGVFMASVDGVGRHFPMTIAYCAEKADRFGSLYTDQASQWYDVLEDFLLSALEPGLVYDEFLEALELLPAPEREPAGESDPHITTAWKSRIRRLAPEDRFEAAFDEIDDERRRLTVLGRSSWWTIGGESHEAFAISADGLPDPDLMSLMLTGHLPPDKETLR